MFLNHCAKARVHWPDLNCYNSYSRPTLLHGFSRVLFHFMKFSHYFEGPQVIRIFEIIKSFWSYAVRLCDGAIFIYTSTF